MTTLGNNHKRVVVLAVILAGIFIIAWIARLDKRSSTRISIGPPEIITLSAYAGSYGFLPFIAQVPLHGSAHRSKEEDLDLPALPVGVGDCGGAEVLVVGQQHHLPFVLGIPRHDTAQQVRAFVLSTGSGQARDLVAMDIAVLRHGTLLDNFEDSIVFETRRLRQSQSSADRPRRASCVKAILDNTELKQMCFDETNHVARIERALADQAGG